MRVCWTAKPKNDSIVIISPALISLMWFMDVTLAVEPERWSIAAERTKNVCSEILLWVRSMSSYLSLSKLVPEQEQSWSFACSQLLRNNCLKLVCFDQLLKRSIKQQSLFFIVYSANGEERARSTIMQVSAGYSAIHNKQPNWIICLRMILDCIILSMLTFRGIPWHYYHIFPLVSSKSNTACLSWLPLVLKLLCLGSLFN